MKTENHKATSAPIDPEEYTHWSDRTSMTRANIGREAVDMLPYWNPDEDYDEDPKNINPLACMNLALIAIEGQAIGNALEEGAATEDGVLIVGALAVAGWQVEYCDRNPCRKTGLQKRPAKQKPEIPDADIAMILEELKAEPQWMSTSFQIAIAHGTRLRATSVDLRRDVDWQRWTITFYEKGGKIFTVPLAEQLRPLFERLRAEGHERTCVLPKDASKQWRRFFDRIGRPTFSFHATRVTVITKLARAGVGQSQAMKYVGHSSVEIHRQYQRLHCEDLGDCAEALKPAITLPADFTLPVWDSDDECDGAELVRM